MNGKPPHINSTPKTDRKLSDAPLPPLNKQKTGQNNLAMSFESPPFARNGQNQGSQRSKGKQDQIRRASRMDMIGGNLINRSRRA